MNCFHHGAPLCRYLPGAAAFDAAFAGVEAFAFAGAEDVAFFGFALDACGTDFFALVALAALAALERDGAFGAAFFFAERAELLVFMRRTH